MSPANLVEGALAQADPGSKTIQLVLQGQRIAAMTPRSAAMFRDSLGGAIEKLLCPSNLFTWQFAGEQQQSAVLFCYDASLQPRLQPTPIPAQLNGFVGPSFSGYVMLAGNGQYIAASGPWQESFRDFEDAQAAVAGRVRQTLGIQ